MRAESNRKKEMTRTVRLIRDEWLLESFHSGILLVPAVVLLVIFIRQVRSGKKTGLEKHGTES